MTEKCNITTDRQLHTPGPWHVYSRNSLCVESATGNIALVNLARASEADARLIAAAPDLLAALKDLADWLAYGLNKADGAEPTAEDHAACERVAAQARAAVDKAEGRS